MQKVIVQIDWHAKIVLTLIAVLLAGLLAKPYIVTKSLNAATANKGEYSITPEKNRVWVLEKLTGRLSLLAVREPFNDFEVVSDGYLDEILKRYGR